MARGEASSCTVRDIILGSALLQPIRSTTQIWVVKHHQYGICAGVPQTSFPKETSWWRCEMSAIFSGHSRRCVNKLLILLPLRVFKTLSQYSYPYRYPLGLCAKKYKTALDVNI